MKKILIIFMIIMLVMSVTACSSFIKKESSKTSVSEAATNSLPNQEDQNQNLSWPKEATELGIPEIKTGTITSANVVPVPITKYKENVTLEISGFTKEALEKYKEQLVVDGFLQGEVYPEDALLNYTKSGDQLELDLTMTFDAQSGDFSMIAINKASDTEAEGYVPDENISLSEGMPSEVPEFTKGSLIDSTELDMGEGMIMYSSKYKEVGQDDIDAYEKELMKAGFEKGEDGYQMMDATGLSMVMVGIEFDGNLLTLVTAKANAMMGE